MARVLRLLGADEAELVVDGILATAGPGRVLVSGLGGEPLARVMRSRGLEAHFALTLSAATELAREAPYDVVILWHVLDAVGVDDAYFALEGLRPRVRRALLVRTDCTERRSGSIGQKWMEHGALLAGYRKHPLFLQLSPYEGRELDTAEDFLLLQPIAPEVLARRPLDALAAERDLHMDMLREGGRRSDAHVERYRLALQYVRPGDTVLDAACGMGYGSRVIFEGSAAARLIGIDESESAVAYATDCYGKAGEVEFRRADAQDLGFLGDASVDLVVSFETLEHLPDPLRLLDEAKRVLRPGGRIVACVPNEWVDEHGVDPNPHHHHVYNWEKLRAQVGERFRVERAFRQIGGGGMTHTHAGRLMRPFDPREAPGDAEWVIVVAMADPLAGDGVPYEETTFRGYEEVPGFNVANFDADYANPWLVKAMVSIGFRFEDPRGLVGIAREVLERSNAESADAGAALCVLAYAALEHIDGAADTPQLRQQLAAYADNAGPGPHQLRWAISNLYVLGLLQMAGGDAQGARASFERCSAMDPVQFSPLLATKTIGAAYQAGLLAALAGDETAARAQWTHGITTAHRVFAGDWANVVGREDHPLYFGLPEVTLAVSKASRCAFALAAVADLRERPGRFWVEVSRDIETQAARGTRTLRHALSALSNANAAAGGEGTPPELRSALEQQAATMGEMHRMFELQARNIAALTASLRQREQALIDSSQELLRQRENIETMRHSLAQHADSSARLHSTLAERDQALARQNEHMARQAHSISALQSLLGERDVALTSQGRALTELQATFAMQAGNVARLNERIVAGDTELAEARAQLAESRERLRAIESGWVHRWLGRWMGPRR